MRFGDVHIAAVIENIQRASDVDFQRRGDVLGFLLILRPQEVIQVLQDRHIFRARVIQIIVVDQPHTAVDDGFLDRLQTLLAAHD